MGVVGARDPLARRARGRRALTVRRALPAVAAVAALGLAVGTGPASAAAPPPVFTRASATGGQLFRAYSDALVARDKARIRAILGPSFMIQRGNGSWANRATYLADLPALRDYALTQVHQSRSRGTLTMVGLTTADLMVDGVPFRTTPAPMMAVFRWSGGRWWLVAQGNFNTPK